MSEFELAEAERQRTHGRGRAGLGYGAGRSGRFALPVWGLYRFGVSLYNLELRSALAYGAGRPNRPGGMIVHTNKAL